MEKTMGKALSDAQKLADSYKNKLIEAKEAYNNDCLKCGKVYKRMVRIGALIFCNRCFKSEFFGQTEFTPKSKLGRIYYRWVRKWKQL